MGNINFAKFSIAGFCGKTGLWIKLSTDWNFLTRHIFQHKNDEVSLYIGYRSTAFLETENFFHRPTVCLPSSGWQEISTDTRIVRNVPSFGNLPVTEMVMENMGTKYLVYFWFQTKSRATDDKNVNRFHLSLHALTRHNTPDLFIRPILTIRSGESLDELEPEWISSCGT